MASKKRRASKEYAEKIWNETRSVAKVARRLGYTDTGAARLLHRFGIVSTKTGRSK